MSNSTKFLRSINSRHQRGLTLIELAIALVLSAAVLIAIMVLHQPFLTQFNSAFNFQRLRSQISSPMDTMRRELEQSKAVSVDSGQCYWYCLVDRASGNRIYYYWQGADLYRKSENGTSPLVCTDGKPFATSLDNGKSTVNRSQDFLSVNLSRSGTSGSSYELLSGFFPTASERQALFYEGFECASLAGRGWSLSTPSEANWALEATGAGMGTYWLKENLNSDQGSPLNASAEIPLNLSRTGSALLQFRYHTVGSLDASDLFLVSFYDGSWHDVFRDDLDGGIGGGQLNTVDLSSFNLGASNRLRFSGSLMHQTDHWVIDAIEIFSK